jgi:hypothetical protein
MTERNGRILASRVAGGSGGSGAAAIARRAIEELEPVAGGIA